MVVKQGVQVCTVVYVSCVGTVCAVGCIVWVTGSILEGCMPPI